MRVDHVDSPTGPGNADAQGFCGPGFDGYRSSDSSMNLNVDPGAIANPNAAFEVPPGRYGGRDTNQAVIVLHQRLRKPQGDVAFLLNIELTGGTTPVGETVYVRLVSLG